MEGYVGEIRLFAASFAPLDWAYCQGQLININSNTALYSILGMQYGGNGTTYFMLPNLAGRVVVGSNPGAGFSNGDIGGVSTHTLQQTEMAAHAHLMVYKQPIQGKITVNGGPAGSQDSILPDGALVCGDNSATLFSSGGVQPLTPMAASSLTVGSFKIPQPTVNVVGTAGNGTPHNNMQPYLGLGYIVCLRGSFPERD